MNTWRDLDRATRKALLRGEPAADPETDRIARAYAEKVLQRSAIARFLIILPVSLVTGMLLGFAAGAIGVTLTGFIIVIALLMIAWIIVASRRKLALIRILNVSNGGHREAVAPGSPERLEVKVPAWGALRIMAPALLFTVPLLIAGALLSLPWLTVPGAIGTAFALAYLTLLLSTSRPGDVDVFDAAGVHMPKYGLRVGWESVREIRVVPLRATAKDARQVLAFLLHDDQVYLRQLPTWVAFLVKMNKKTYLSPMVWMDGLVDRPIDEIAATAAALSGLPVSRTPR